MLLFSTIKQEDKVPLTRSILIQIEITLVIS